MRNIGLIRLISRKRAFEMSIACFGIWYRAEVVHLCGIALINLSSSSPRQHRGIFETSRTPPLCDFSAIPCLIECTTHIAKVGERIVNERRKTPIDRPCRGERVAEREDMVTIDEATAST